MVDIVQTDSVLLIGITDLIYKSSLFKEFHLMDGAYGIFYPSIFCGYFQLYPIKELHGLTQDVYKKVNNHHSNQKMNL